MRTLSKRLIRIGIIVVVGLLVANFLLTNRNNRIIEENRIRQREAEEVKLTVSRFAIMIIHNVDLGIRSYALFNEEKYLYPFQIATTDKDSLMNVLELGLRKQHYPLEEFRQLHDSIDSYIALNRKLLELLRAGKKESFFLLANQDKGYQLWLQYESFAEKVNNFEDNIVGHARQKLEEAEALNYMIQVLLFLVCVPTLLITAYHAYQKFAYEVKLRKVAAEKAELLATENERLERLVAKRTMEIEEKNKILQVQHEEISTQNEEIVAQNDELQAQREALAVQIEALAVAKKEQLEILTRNVLEKSELIGKLSDEIEFLKTQQTIDPEHVQNFNKVLHATILTEDDWERFKKTFEEVYPNFFANLRYRFPLMTNAELRLAALIKLNLTLKEAANALGISADSVKKSRYRLKKRISLPEDESLEEFIRSL